MNQYNQIIPAHIIENHNQQAQQQQNENHANIPDMPQEPPPLVRQNAIAMPLPEQHMNNQDVDMNVNRDYEEDVVMVGGKRKSRRRNNRRKRKTNKKRLFTLKKGDLTKYGYHISSSNATTRHKALGKARKHYPHNTMIRKLNALAVLHKNKKPIYTKRARRDMEYLRKTRKNKNK